MDHMEHVSHCLRGMVYIALEVNKSRSLFEYAVPVSLFDSIYDLVHICIAFSYVHVVPYPDHIGHE